jgi:two-component system OmpR family response regulator
MSQYTPAIRPDILVVDDYVDALDVWAIMLDTAGFEVRTASTGPQALEAVNMRVPDLIVMDLLLPGLSGFEVAKELRRHDKTRHVPLIAVTGCTTDTELSLARQSGFTSILRKPCEPPALVEEIRRLLPSD